MLAGIIGVPFSWEIGEASAVIAALRCLSYSPCRAQARAV